MKTLRKLCMVVAAALAVALSAANVEARLGTERGSLGPEPTVAAEVFDRVGEERPEAVVRVADAREFGRPQFVRRPFEREKFVPRRFVRPPFAVRPCFGFFSFKCFDDDFFFEDEFFEREGFFDDDRFEEKDD
ncbi:MAG: hypothetical protein ACYDA8_11850 [Deferrisomatales bacterium]